MIYHEWHRRQLLVCCNAPLPMQLILEVADYVCRSSILLFLLFTQTHQQQIGGGLDNLSNWPRKPSDNGSQGTEYSRSTTLKLMLQRVHPMSGRLSYSLGLSKGPVIDSHVSISHLASLERLPTTQRRPSYFSS